MTATLFNDAFLIDGTGADPQRGVSVLVESGAISRIGAAGAIRPPEGAAVIDCAGRTLMPGLMDAHVHFGLVEAAVNEPPESHVSYAIKVLENMRIALEEGFTSVRDAGGLDPAFALAVAEGQAPGPRILPAGSFITQTGGHGDDRTTFDDHLTAPIPGLRAFSEVVDGVDAVRAAARRQIRRGATQVKLMASGGVMSPTDPLESVQFTVAEMAAAVEEAEHYGKYVMAHCHTSPAMKGALAAGVRSIEHGSIMDEEVAALMASNNAYLVPTLVIIEILARAQGLPENRRAKLELVRSAMRESLATAGRAGVRIASGSDLLGPRQSRRASELVERARESSPMEAIISATRTNAELFRMADRIGTVEPGKDADLILVNGDPLADVGVLVDAANVPLVMQQGRIVKDVR
jgi:imidazolonepropionase-like amidohydrolase